MIIEKLFSKLSSSNAEEFEEFELHLTYSKIPMTIALKKRQLLEEQRKKHNVPKEKSCTLM